MTVTIKVYLNLVVLSLNWIEVSQFCPTLYDPMDYITCQVLPSVGFSRQEYWNGLPFPSPGDLPNSGIKPRSPTLQADSLPTEPPGNLHSLFKGKLYVCCCLVTQSCPTLCDPMDCSTPGFPVLRYLLEFVQTHVHWVSDAIQPSHPLLPPSPLTLNLSTIRVFFSESALCIRWPK